MKISKIRRLRAGIVAVFLALLMFGTQNARSDIRYNGFYTKYELPADVKKNITEGSAESGRRPVTERDQSALSSIPVVGDAAELVEEPSRPTISELDGSAYQGNADTLSGVNAEDLDAQHEHEQTE